MTVKQFKKFPSIPHVAEIPEIRDGDLEVYEKMDGGNTQVRVINGRLFCGNRSKFLEKEKFFKMKWFKEFKDWVMANYSFYNLPENLILYGEWTSKHTLSYHPKFTDKFFMIDLKDLNDGRFIPYFTAKEMLTELGVEGVLFLNLLHKGKITKTELEKLAIGRSDYSYGWREGVVVKDYENQLFGKLWRSSVGSKKRSLEEDIRRLILGYRDEGISFKRQELYRRLHREFGKSGRDTPFREVKKAADNYLRLSGKHKKSKLVY